MATKHRERRAHSTVLYCLLLIVPLLLACSVPVFRYALERWPADSYQVAVFHKGPLAPSDQKLVEWLRTCGAAGGQSSALVVRTVDLAAQADEAKQKRPPGMAEDKLPWMLVDYPRTSRIPVPAWSGPLTVAAAKALVESPVRRQVADRLLGGDAAVWLLLESGVREHDEAAARLLDAELKKMAKALKLPALTDEADDLPPEGVARPALGLAFSMLRVSRSDPAERMLVEMLLHTEEDLATLKEPMVFPVYGRGRALFALVGKGINEENIGEACAFLVGPCSCQVKAMNPGTDLLMMVKWDELLMGEQMAAPALASLPELSLPPAAEPTDAPAAKPAEPAEPPEAVEPKEADAPERVPHALVRNIVVAVVLGLMIVGAAAFALARATRRPRS